MLGEGANAHVPIHVDAAFLRYELALHHLQKRTLACTVHAEDTDSAFDGGADSRVLEKSLLAGVTETDRVGLYEIVLRQLPRAWEPDRHRSRVSEGDGRILNLLHFVDHLLLAFLLLDNLRAEVVRVDELHNVVNFSLLLIVSPLLRQSELLSRLNKRFVIALVVRKLLTIEEHDVGDDIIKETPIV